MSPAIDLHALAKAASTGGRTRAPLVIWMCEHHDEFAAILDRHGVNWARITAFFAEAGFTAAGGQPLIPGTVRSYWARARKLVAARRARDGTSPPAATQGQALGVTPATSPNDDQAVSAERAPAPGALARPVDPTVPPKPKFEFVKLRNDGRGVSEAERRALGDPTAPADPGDPGRRRDPSG